ncbi:MAG: hypothetical protein JRD89_03670 [Deltaproteobacteria bacterium]|nr:hypothetical protein [Deltaproteobacteria bacterium]
MATGTSEYLDNTSQDYFIPEVWSPIILDSREANLLFAQFCDTRYEKGLTKGDVIHVNDLPLLSAREKSENTAVQYETVSHSQTDISIDQYYYAAIAVEKETMVQALKDQAAMFAPKMGYALALQIDDTVAGLVDDLNNHVGTLTVGTTVNNWIRAVQYLDDANAPDEDRVAIVSPAEWGNIIQQDFFVKDSYKESVGQLSAKAKRGYFGSALGVNFYKSSNVEGTNAAGHDNALFHKSAFALVRQLAPTTESQYDIDYLARKIVSYELFGTQEMRNDHGVWVKGK